MKGKKYQLQDAPDGDIAALREEFVAYSASSSGAALLHDDAPAAGDEAAEMVRTQVYLTPGQRDFLQSEARRRGISMAAALRHLVTEKMQPDRSAWLGNPLLDEPVGDPSFASEGTGSENPDAAIYGQYEEA